MCKKLLASFLRIPGAFTTLESQTSSPCAVWARMTEVPPSMSAHTQNAVTPPYTGDISGCGSHVRQVHLGHCMTCPYCSDKKYYNADGWCRHMKEKHNKVPWYSGEVRAPPDSATEATLASSPIVQDPIPPVVSVSARPELEIPEDTLPHVETLQDDDDALLDAEPTDPAESRPLTPSTEEIECQLEQLPNNTRDYEYSVHQTHHPAAPVIVSRFRRFDTPDDTQHVAQATAASTLPEPPELDPPEDPLQRKRSLHTDRVY